MKNYFYIFICICLIAIIISYFIIPDIGLGKNAKLFKDYPINEKFILSNGQHINMPWHIYEAHHAVLISEAHNPDIVYNILNGIGFYPLLSSNKLPIIAVGIVEYIDGAAGKYNEIYVSFVASKSPPLNNTIMEYIAFIMEINPLFKSFRGLLGLDGVSLVVWKMYVDTELSLLGGREIWGYPKELADINIKKGSKQQILSADISINGELLMNISQSGIWPIYSIPLAMYLDGTSATTRTIFHSIGESKGQTLSKIKAYDKTKDKLEISKKTSIGKEISSLEIEPWLWIDIPIFEVVLFPPYYIE